jgi:hypothetical protein
VKMSKALTDKGTFVRLCWAVAVYGLHVGWEHVKGPLIAYLVERKEARLEKERLENRDHRTSMLWKKVTEFRRTTMTPREFFPTMNAIASHPFISEVIDSGDDEAFEYLKKTIGEKLPGIRDEVRRDREESLMGLLPPGYTSPEPLKLATTWFGNGLVSRVGRAEDVMNELWCVRAREHWDMASVVGGVLPWDKIAPRIGFEKEVKEAITKLIADLGVGDPEKMTAEELDNVRCRVAMFTKKDTPILNMEIGSWRHLVSVFLPPFSKKSSLGGNRCERSRMLGLGSPAGGPSKTTNSRM